MDTKIKKAPGIYEGLSFEDYLNIDAFHKSMVAPALRSTEHLNHYILEEKKSSKIMDFGSLVDCMLLEPEIFGDTFSETPKMGEDAKGNPKPWNNQLKYCRAWTAEQRELGLTPYSESDYNRSLIINEKIWNHKTASSWLEGAKYQVAIVWEDKETGILCKSRLDILREDGLSDLKITGNASPSEFARTMNSMGYHIQAAIYTEGLAQLNGGEVLPWGFIAAEADAPHCVATYDIGDESILVGKFLFRKALNRYKDYLESGHTGYSDFAEEIEIPQWAINQAEGFDESKLGDTV